MSNTMLGTVYLRIMDDVIDNCHTTFEEEGVSQQTLEELRTTWQTKLSAFKVGSFPWEPPPAPQPMANPGTVPSNVPRHTGLPSSSGPAPSVPSNNEPRIKTEPGTEPKMPSLPPNYANNDAKENVMANLRQKFGADATAQINQIQSQMLSTGQGRAPMNPSRPDMTPEQQRAQHAEFQRRQQAAQYQHQMQHARQHPAANTTQTDGTQDWNGFVADRRARAPDTTQEADLSIRQQIEQSNRQNEGGGLMMPLADQSTVPQAKRRKIDSDGDASSGLKFAQVDGGDDDDEDTKGHIKDELFDDDEDAINSDLDDPDDNEIEEEQDDGKPQQVMLCTYDKVQRVKNKWKCALRDGVLNSGGKEYVFGKANGEFEW